VVGSDVDAALAKFATEVGVQYISAWHAFCDESGCLTRVGPSDADLVASDPVHLTEKGSAFLIGSISQQLFGNMDRVPSPK
jgi:hypothetical protein